MARAPVPAWKKLLFSLVAVGAGLLSLELVLWGAGVELLIDRDDEGARALMIQHVKIDGSTILDAIKKMDERI